jgi:iron complex transport system ATP-binding protein
MAWPSGASAVPPARVHVVSGGGAGAALLRHLVADGHAVTAGVLNVGDSDWETARALGLEMAEEAPFSAISAASAACAADLIAAADVVIVAAMPIGPGNIENLRLARHAAANGGSVLLVGDMPASRDFTGGAARELWSAAVGAGAETFPDLAAALSRLEARA